MNPDALAGFRRKVLQVAGGTALAQGMIVACSPVLARLYSPADFGVLAVYVSLVSLLVTVASLRFEQALPLPKGEGEAASLLLLCILLVATTTLGGGLVIHLLRRPILAWMGEPRLGPFLWLVPVSVLGGGLYQVFNAWAIRKERYDRIARTRLTQSLTQLGIQVGAGALGAGAAGLLVGDAVGRSNGTRTLAALDWGRDWDRLRRVRGADLLAAARRYRAFPLLSSGTALLNTLNLRLPGLLMAIAYGPADAGCFTLAQRVFALPSAIIGESVAQVFFGESAQAREAGSLMPLFRGTVARMFILGLPLMGLSALAGWTLFPALFGEAWRRAGHFTAAMAPMALAQFTGACVSSALVVLERQDLALARELLRSCLLLGGILTAWRLRWDAQRAVGLFALTGTLSYLFYGWITWYAIRRHDAAGRAR
ncbi:MAG TPA: oligosaccharide flippase family protein [Holophaga sp.]|nr:oligosaccharide flippase family protein [Holophaga sp.]